MYCASDHGWPITISSQLQAAASTTIKQADSRDWPCDACAG